jgi:hypothetical protein
MFKFLKKGDAVLCSELPLLLLLLLVVVLRFPNFFEPYWYGDEAIYLTVGTALRQGALMYAEIVDHKTPLIYYFASVPNQLWFRVLNLGWMIATTALFYHISLRLFKRVLPTIVSTLLLVIFTTLPWFEGNIPNGELFVMGFILAGGLLLLYTQLGGILVEDKAAGWLSSPPPATNRTRFAHAIQVILAKNLTNTHDLILYVGAGLFFGLAILTKVPAIFDVAGFLSLGWFALVNTLPFNWRSFKTWLAASFDITTDLLVIGLSTLLPIFISIMYYASKGTLQAYTDLGLLYNFKYIQAWDPGYTSAIAKFLITLPGKVSVVTAVVLLVSLGRKLVDRRLQFFLSWFALTMMAALLSNRPYPHYFMQVMPPLCLMVGFSVLKLQQFVYKKSLGSILRADLRPVVLALMATLASIQFLVWILLKFNVGVYPTVAYYKNTADYLTGTIDRDTYYQSFNGLMRDNYEAAQIITQVDEPHLFIWGNNAALYALTKRSPVGRFTVTFHITDFKAEAETFQDLVTTKPTFAVVMKGETAQLPGLKSYLYENYWLNNNFTTFELWMKK